MRNYIFFAYGFCNYVISLEGGGETTGTLQAFANEFEDLESEISRKENDVIAGLPPGDSVSFGWFSNTGYLLLDKDIVIRMLRIIEDGNLGGNINPDFVNEGLVVFESPKDTWSHGH